MLIKLGHDFFELSHIAVVRPSSLNKKQSIIFTIGSSALDGGFLVDLPCEKVLVAIEEARLNEVAWMLAQAEENESGQTPSEKVGDGTEEDDIITRLQET
jgi:hypothetical protein